MARWSKKDYQRLNRATRCDLCNETMGREDRALNWSPSTGNTVSHPGCFEAQQADGRRSIEQFAALMQRAAELELEAAGRQRLASAGLWVP